MHEVFIEYLIIIDNPKRITYLLLPNPPISPLIPHQPSIHRSHIARVVLLHVFLVNENIPVSERYGVEIGLGDVEPLGLPNSITFGKLRRG